jgi:hypothetical protein
LRLIVLKKIIIHTKGIVNFKASHCKGTIRLSESIFGTKGKKGFPEDSINFVKLEETPSEAIITASE